MGATVAAVLVAGCLAAASPTGAVEIVPHRAFYTMSLAAADSRSNIADVEGAMLFEWADSCDGWAVTQKLAMTVYYSTGESSEFGWNLTSWESKDGLKYRFFVRRMEDASEEIPLRGDAALDGVGKGGSAHYVQPEERTVDLPVGTLFPTAHSLALLAEAEAGKPFFFADVFDGSDEDGLFGVGAIIGKRMEPERGGDDRNSLLTEAPSWRLRLAFFPHASPAPEPEHEQIFRLHGNGIAEELVLDYGDFSVRAALGKVERLPKPGC